MVRIDLHQLPCVVYGLSQTDLYRTEANGGIAELGELLGYCDQLGISTGPLATELDAALTDFESGNYDLAAHRLRGVVPGAYQTVMDIIYPMVQEGMEDPRQSQIPLSSLTRLSTAAKMLVEGNGEEGTILMLRAMRDWSASIDEPFSLIFLVLLAGFTSGGLWAGPPSSRTG